MENGETLIIILASALAGIAGYKAFQGFKKKNNISPEEEDPRDLPAGICEPRIHNICISYTGVCVDCGGRKKV